MTRADLAYGAPGLVLAMVAMPVYLLLPPFYAQHTALGLSLIGLILVLTRLGDALIDPWIGRLIDARLTRQAVPRSHLHWMLLAVPVMLLGLALLFAPPQRLPLGLDPDTISLRGWQTVWLVVALVLTYGGFAVASIAHQAWGVALGMDAEHRARLAATREGAALAGVVLASVAGGALGPVWLTPLAAVAALATLGWALRRAPSAVGLRHVAHANAQQPCANEPHEPQKSHSTLAMIDTIATQGPRIQHHRHDRDTLSPWSQPAFRRLYTVFVLNGIASALPATLVLFFMRDAIGLDDSTSAGLLALYFVAAACALPLWLRLAARQGQRAAWLTSMAMSIAAFVGCLLLQPGDVGPYAAIVLMTGLALGADLVLPSALLAGVIAAAGAQGRADGRYVGLWQVATKANLALAAGLALPALAWLGYDPQASTDATTGLGLTALTWAYAGLPCVFKLLAALVLARSPMPEQGATSAPLQTQATATTAAKAQAQAQPVPAQGQLPGA